MRCVDKDRQSRRTRWGLALLALAGISVQSGPAEAQNWQIEPLLRVGAEFDDNARLDPRTDEEIELNGWLAEASARIAYTTERTTFEMTPRILLREYSDNPEFDSEDFFFRGLFRHTAGKSSVGFRVNFDQQQVRTGEREVAELDIDDPGEITDDGSGRVSLIGERSKWILAPYWEYRLSASSFFGVDIDYLNVEYDDELSLRLNDYSDARVNLNYRRSVSEKTSMIVMGSVRHFERSDSSASDRDGYRAMVGINRDLSPTSQLRALVGYETTDLGVQGDHGEPVAEISLRHRLETIRLLALYRRVISASGNGALSVRDSIMLNATRRLSEKISVSIGLRAYQSENISDLTREDRKNVQLRSRFTWNFTRAFSMEVDYRYTILDRGLLDGESANNNQVNIWFAYEPNSSRR